MHKNLQQKRLSVSDGFRIASMSKTFTGTIVMQLMEEGTLDIDAPFFDYLQIDTGTQNKVGANAADLVDTVVAAVIQLQ
jgi:CubicO group peptidase (beta-lactamase class C family)